MNKPTHRIKLVAWAALAGAVVACGSPRDTDPGAAASLSDTEARPGFFGRSTRQVAVPSGTLLTVELEEAVSSAQSRPGDALTARVVEPVSVHGRVAIGAGSIVKGRVVQAVASKRVGGRARLSLEFTSVELPSGDESAISASFHGLAKSQTKKDAATIGGATAGGALLGRIIGHQRGRDAHGTTVGALVGAAVGTGVAVSNRGQEVILAEGSTIRIELEAPALVTIDA